MCFPIILPISFGNLLFTQCDGKEVTKAVSDTNADTEEHDRNDSAENQIMKPLDYEMQNEPLAMDENKSDECGNFLDDEDDDVLDSDDGQDETSSKECAETVIPTSHVDVDDITENSEETFLLHYGAQIKSLLRLASDCDDIISDAINSELVYPQDVLAGVLDAVSKVKEFSAKVESDCQGFLAKLNQKKMNIGMPELDDDFFSRLPIRGFHQRVKRGDETFRSAYQRHAEVRRTSSGQLPGSLAPELLNPKGLQPKASVHLAMSLDSSKWPALQGARYS